MTKQKKSLGIGILSIGFLFFMNPNISIIDLLPDFIGYLLLCRGLSRIADLNESVFGAMTIFRRMILIDAGKWLALMWVFGISVPNERSSSLLLWSFVFAVAEMICLIPAYHKLFEGLNQLGYFYPNSSIFLEQSGRKKNATDRMKRLTLVFVSMKAILSFLPELADLSNNVYDEGSEWINLYRYIGVIRMMAFLPVLILGLVWGIRILLYFRRIRKDGLLIPALIERYEAEVSPKVGLFTRRRFRTIQWMLTLALCLTVDLRLENRNMLPDFLAALFFLIALFLLYQQVKSPKLLWIPLGGAYMLSAVFVFMMENRFFQRYTYGAIIKSDEARSVYLTLIIVTVLQSLLMIGLFWTITRALFSVIQDHTGFVVGMERRSETEDKMVEDLHRELKKTVLWGFVAIVLYGILDVLYPILAPKIGFIGIVQFVFAAIAIVTVWRALSAVRQAIDTKYMLE